MPRRAFSTSAPPHAGARPALFTGHRAASAAPSRRSDFRRCFERCDGANVRLPPLGAPTAPQPASVCWARWLPPLRARSGPREPTARRLFGCGSGPVSQPEIRAHRAGRPGRRGAAGRESGKVRAGNLPRLRTPRAGSCARRASAQAHSTTVPRPCPADQRPLQSGAQAAAAAQVPPTGRRRHGGTCADSPRRRQWSAESSEGVIYAPGRPAVCKRGLLPAARGLSGEPEGVGRLRTSGAALCRALCHFRAAVAACGNGGRAAAAGGQHTRVCRRIRCPVLVLRTHTSWLSKRYPNPPSQERPLPKDHTAAARSAPAPFRTATGAGI